jgi:protein SCO1/2
MKRLLTAVAAVAVLATAGCGGGDDHELVGLTRDPEPQVDGTPLPDVANGGAPFTIKAPARGLLIVYFGYTNCPDLCPTTLSDLKVALGDLGDDASRVAMAMITVDPKRDTAVLADYVRSFVPNAHALATEDQAALQAVAGPFGVSYQVATSPSGEVQVSHSNYLFAVDDAGNLVLTWPVGLDAETTTSTKDLAADIELLLRDPDATHATTAA